MSDLFLRWQRSKRSLIESLGLDNEQTAILNEWFKQNCFEIGRKFASTLEVETTYKNNEQYKSMIRNRMCREIINEILKKECLYSEVENQDPFTGNTIREFSILVFGDPIYIKRGGK